MSLFLWALALLAPVLAAHGLARASLPDGSALERTLASLAGAPVIVLAVVLPLGASGTLAPLPCLAIAVLIAAAALWWAARTARRRAPPPAHPPGDEPALGPTVGVAVGLGTVVLGRQLVEGTAFSFDDLTYHATAVAHWVRDGGFGPTPFNYHAHYPFNAETLSLWLALPTRGDGWVGLAGVLWLALAGLAAAALGRRLGATPAAAAALAALAVATPALADQARTFAAVDLAAAAATLAAAALLLGGGTAPTLARCAWAGSLAGYAVGCKPSFAPAALLLVAAAGWLGGRARRPAARVLTSAVAAAATGSFWYLRNLWLTGNPLFPAAFGPFDGPLGRAEQTRTTMAWWMTSGELDASGWLDMARAHLAWPLGPALVAAAGYAAAVLAERRSADEPSARRSARRLVLALGTLALATYPFVPFAGSTNSPDAPLRIALRFLLLPYLAGLVLTSPAGSSRGFGALWWAGVVVAGATAWGGDGVDAAVALLAAVAVAALTTWSRWIERRVVVVAASVLGATLLAAMTPSVQHATDLRIFSHESPSHPVGRGWRSLEALPADARVAWFGPQTYQYYPVFGRRLQLEPVQVSWHGGPTTPLAVRWRRGERPPWWTSGAPDPVLPEQLCANLRNAGVEYLFAPAAGAGSGGRGGVLRRPGLRGSGSSVGRRVLVALPTRARAAREARGRRDTLLSCHGRMEIRTWEPRAAELGRPHPPWSSSRWDGSTSSTCGSCGDSVNCCSSSCGGT